MQGRAAFDFMFVGPPSTTPLEHGPIAHPVPTRPPKAAVTCLYQYNEIRLGHTDQQPSAVDPLSSCAHAPLL
jgi:hypothetical protein